MAALGIQEETARLAAEVRDRDGVDLQLRVGLNSGQVIAGEIGSGPFGYTAVGEQVGMAQRMESVAPPGGVMPASRNRTTIFETTDAWPPRMADAVVRHAAWCRPGYGPAIVLGLALTPS